MTDNAQRTTFALQQALTKDDLNAEEREAIVAELARRNRAQQLRTPYPTGTGTYEGSGDQVIEKPRG